MKQITCWMSVKPNEKKKKNLKYYQTKVKLSVYMHMTAAAAVTAEIINVVRSVKDKRNNKIWWTYDSVIQLYFLWEINREVFYFNYHCVLQILFIYFWMLSTVSLQLIVFIFFFKKKKCKSRNKKKGSRTKNTWKVKCILLIVMGELANLPAIAQSCVTWIFVGDSDMMRIKKMANSSSLKLIT